MTSRSYRLFLDEIEAGGEQGTVSYALNPLQALEGEERQEAEDRLIALARTGDLRAVETLGLAGVTRSLAVLERLSKATNDLGSAAARAVLQLMGPDGAALARVAEGVKAASRVESAFAAYELRFQDGPEAIAGLLDALRHPFSATRANALLGLQEQPVVAPLIEPRQSPLWVLMQDVSTDLKSVWKPAAERLGATIRALMDGVAPAELGLVYESTSRPGDVDRVWTPNDYGFDFDALLRLRGHDLAWAKSYLFHRLALRDVRAPEAMVVLGMTEALPALRATLDLAEQRGEGAVHRSALDALEAQAAAVGDA